MPRFRLLQRLDRAGLVEVKNGVELSREIRLEVMADALGLGPVDHSDGSLETRFLEQLQLRSAVTEREEKAR